MGYSTPYLSADELAQLQEAFKAYGNKFGFWQVYQQVTRAVSERTGDSGTKVANEMAKAAQAMGVTVKAIYI